MRQYLKLLKTVKESGSLKQDRTGVGTISSFGHQMRFNLQEGFPLVTTKKIHIASVVYELLWFLSGKTNISYLKKNNVSIWDEWADKNGDLGPVYGSQWRSWKDNEGGNIDQIKNTIEQIKNTPNSRRIIVSSWNVGELDKMALHPCHCFFQFYVSEKKLSCQLYQRSADLFIGVPFNIASYCLLTHMFAQQCNLEAGDFIWSGGDCHIYSNHIKQVKKQLLRIPKKLPKLIIKRKAKDIFDYKFTDFEFKNYIHDQVIKAPIAI